MPAPSGYSANLPTDVILDAAVFLINAATPFGVSRGPFTFDPGTAWENVEYDNKFYPKVGLDRKVGGVPKLSGTLIELNATKHAKLEPGSSSATVSGDTTITPQGAGDLLVEGDYLTNVRCAWKRQGGGYALVEFPFALVTKYDVKGKGEVSIEVEARQADDAADEGVAPYSIKYVAALPA